MTKDEALKLALEALEKPRPGVRTDFSDAMAYRENVTTATNALREALAQPEQEPVAIQVGRVYWEGDKLMAVPMAPPQRDLESTTDMMMELADRLGELPDDVDPRAWSHLLVYAPQRQPLTDAEIAKLYLVNTDAPLVPRWDFARAIEAKLKEKNT